MDSKKNKHITSLKLRMVIGFTSLMAVLIFFVVLIFSVRMGRAMKNQTADMIGHLNIQIAANVDSYLDSVSANVDTIWEDPTILSYKSGDSDEGKRLEIEDTLHKVRSSRSYEDFCIVYEDGTSIGKVSDSLTKASGGYLFGYIKPCVIQSYGTWSTTVVPERDKLYYLRPINDKAIIVASLSTGHLTGMFDDSVFMEGMSTYVVDKSLVVQFSNDHSAAPGSYLNTHIYKLVKKDEGASLSEKYAVTTTALENGWYVVSAVPSTEILSTLHSTVAYIITISIVMIIIATLFIILMSNQITAAVSRTVNKLDEKAQTDLLTGLINKRSFEDIVDTTLANPEPGVDYALVFMDVDNFKGVNDRCGHDIGDEVLRSFAHTIGTVFREVDVKGRLGGDEFCVLMKMTHDEHDKLVEAVDEACGRFKDALYKKSTSARQSLPAVTSSMGAAIWNVNAGIQESFGTMYHRADIALYASKKKGKNTWSIYGQNNVDDSILEED